MADITLRSIKGSLLTSDEVDNNFTNINDDKLETANFRTELRRFSGWIDYNDLSSQTVDISVPSNTDTKITNDGAGSFSDSTYKPTSITRLWDTTNNQFDFSDLSNGDVVNIRFDLTIETTSANTDVTIFAKFGIGAFEYNLNIYSEKPFKTAGTYQQVYNFFVVIKDDNTRFNPGELYVNANNHVYVRNVGFIVSAN